MPGSNGRHSPNSARAMCCASTYRRMSRSYSVADASASNAFDRHGLTAAVMAECDDTPQWRLPETRLSERFVVRPRQARSGPPARAMPRRLNCRHIGGFTPCVPTVTRGAAKFPLASLWAMMNTFRPGFRSARVAGAKVTIAVCRGTCTVNVPPL